VDTDTRETRTGSEAYQVSKRFSGFTLLLLQLSSVWNFVKIIALSVCFQGCIFFTIATAWNTLVIAPLRETWSTPVVQFDTPVLSPELATLVNSVSGIWNIIIVSITYFGAHFRRDLLILE
jgi:hypothetical protein